MSTFSVLPYVVTGAASGIGAAVSEQLVAAGATVFGLDRTPFEADGITAVVCDLASSDSIADAAARLPERIAGLANVAGVPGTAPAATVLQVNLLGPRTLTGHLLTRIEEGGAVVNVSSIAAHRNLQPEDALADLRAASTGEDVERWLAAHPVEGPAAYDTSKRALNDWTVLLAADQIAARRRALSVSPGPSETPILGDFEASMGADAIERSAHAVGRHGRPDEIAAVVVFALSAQATWLNGIDIPVEGGLGAVRVAANLPATSVTAGAPGSEQGAPA